MRLWEETPDSIAHADARYTTDQQSRNERRINREIERADPQLEPGQAISAEQRSMLRGQARRVLGIVSVFPSGLLNEAFFDSCESATQLFVREARRFDPTLSSEDLLQAVRNFWVFNSIQGLLGIPVALTPSSLAYSLLYPYTDNLLDSDAGPNAKKELAATLDGWFDGESAATADPLQRKILRLLDMIEAEFPRRKYADVHGSLQTIHRAQERSLLLHGHPNGESEHDLTAITIGKGGTSVLADGYLACGPLTEDQSEALFGYGVLLQLIDDLRDLAEDIEAGHSTPFTRAFSSGRLEGVTGRLLQFTGHCCKLLEREEISKSSGFHEAIARSAALLIADAVAQHDQFYDKTFAMTIERSIPVGFPFLRAAHEKMHRYFEEKADSEALAGAEWPIAGDGSHVVTTSLFKWQS